MRRDSIVAVQTFGDYLVFHPHLHVLLATGLFDDQGRFHHNKNPAEACLKIWVRPPGEPLSRPASSRKLRPLWRDLIIRIWEEDPMVCPCCKATMKNAGTMIRGEEVEFFLRLHGLWAGVLDIPPPPEPPYDVETMEPIGEASHQWQQESPPLRLEVWERDAGPAGRALSDPDDQRTWEPDEIRLDDGRVLVFDGGEPPPGNQASSSAPPKD